MKPDTHLGENARTEKGTTEKGTDLFFFFFAKSEKGTDLFFKRKAKKGTNHVFPG
jgi:hypothetical protein